MAIITGIKTLNEVDLSFTLSHLLEESKDLKVTEYSPNSTIRVSSLVDDVNNFFEYEKFGDLSEVRKLLVKKSAKISCTINDYHISLSLIKGDVYFKSYSEKQKPRKYCDKNFATLKISTDVSSIKESHRESVYDNSIDVFSKFVAAEFKNVYFNFLIFIGT